MKPTTKVVHKPIKHFAPERRIKLDAKVTDKSGVHIVRCYFRVLDQADYVFVEMMATGKDMFESILPAPSMDTETIVYLFLVVNAQNQVVKTQTFEVHKKDDDKVPAWQQVSSAGDITLSTELTYVTKAPSGFTDSMVMDVVKPSARFGFVAEGLYGTSRSTAVAIGYLSGTAATATSGGIASASTGGISALTVATAVGGAVAVGAAAGGGGGGGDNTPTTTTKVPTSTYYRDSDGDGYGDPGDSQTGTTPPAGYVANASDCDDTNGSINPGATEICNGVDDNCNSTTDEGCTTYYQDSDSDTYGNPAASQVATSQPAGYVTDSGDCDDSDPGVNPGATEICNGVDDDCDTQTDEGCNLLYWDGDSDGYGNPAGPTSTVPQAGYVTNASDCDDTNGSINPGATEICNGVDDNCNSTTDEGCTTYYQDSDSDTYGNPAVSQVATSQPAGYVTDSSDCDDSDHGVNPGATEICNDGIDNDCDGYTDGTDSDCNVLTTTTTVPTTTPTTTTNNTATSPPTVDESNFVGTYSGLDPNRTHDEYKTLITFDSGGKGSIKEWINGEQRGTNGLKWSFETRTSVFSFKVDTGANFQGEITYPNKFTLTGVWQQGDEGSLTLTKK